MSSGKNIEIRIAATGGDQAAAEIRKVEQATERAKQEAVLTTRGFGGMLDGVPERADEAAKSIEKISDAAKPLAQDLKKVEDNLETTGQKSDAATGSLGGMASKLGYAGVAAAAAAAGKVLNEVWKGLESISIIDLRNIDSAMADQIETAKTWSQALSDPIGLLLELTTGTSIKAAFDGMNEQLALGAKQQAEAVDRLLEKGVQSRDEIKRLADEIRAANDILDANDKADSKERDAQDAAEIRAGVPEEDVKSRRAKDDAAKEIERINRELAPFQSAADSVGQNFATRQGNMATLEDNVKKLQAAEEEVRKLKIEKNNIPGANSNQNGSWSAPVAANRDAILAKEKEIEAAERQATFIRGAHPTATRERLAEEKKKLEDAEKELKRVQAELQTKQTIAGADRRGVESGLAGTLESLQAQKDSRLEAERQRLEEQNKIANQAADRRVSQRSSRASEQDHRTNTRRANSLGDKGFDAAAEAERMGNRAGADALRKKAEDIMANPTAKGSDEMVGLMERFLSWAEKQPASANGNNPRILAIENKLRILEARQSNSRKPGQ